MTKELKKERKLNLNILINISKIILSIITVLTASTLASKGISFMNFVFLFSILIIEIYSLLVMYEF
ncbi:hypothetical protein [Pseudostreptobacillus hongkongensis]|uniref:hypothetical protein n=1 Tax=Pseudostreptobacillus hongkongensis TaxID=1162717 RepID=UPI00082DD2B8|nr:hypothetical protein [Pseudostreptobacillus hongkongensis]